MASIHHTLVQLSMKEVAPLWYKFRDAAPPAGDDVHLQYCELIQEAIGHNQVSEAFGLLVEGLRWCELAAEA